MRRCSGITAVAVGAVACVLVVGALVTAQEPRATAAAPGGGDARKVEIKKAVVPAPGGITAVKVVAPGAVAKKVVANPPAVLPPGARVLQPNLDMMVAQTELQQRWLLKSEYQLVLTACEPAKSQRKPIARAGEAAIKTSARRVVEWQAGRAPGALVGPPIRPDPRAIIRDALAAAVKDNLSPAQAARYRDELAKRVEFETRVAVQDLVARLDRLMRLSPEQREAIRASLIEHSNDAQTPHRFSLFTPYDDQYAPMIPDSWFVAILSPAQKKAWSSTIKFNPESFVNGIPGFGMENDPLEDAELDEPPNPEPKP